MERIILYILLNLGFLHVFASASISVPPMNPNGTMWALLVAGSYGWDNYRHQADICHAYQILHSCGILDENIIVMMYDDIAFHKDNPTPGVIINYPDGPDIYKGVPKDYTGDGVNTENFFAVLTGRKFAINGTGSGKVIESGPDDIVFVSFAGYGGLGVLGLPEDDIFAYDFVKTIDFMHAKSKYSKLIIYVEYSLTDSIFGNLLLGTKNVFSLTAGHPQASSQAVFFDEKRKTYLSNVFSYAWMGDIESESLPEKNLHQHYANLLTLTSQVEEHSDLDIGVTKLKDILGYKKKLRTESERFNLSSSNVYIKPPLTDTADNADVSHIILQKKLFATEDPDERSILKFKINELLNKRKVVDQTLEKLIVRATGNISERKNELEKSKYRLSRDNSLCYKTLCTMFSKNRNSFYQNPYARGHLQKLVNMCSVNWLKNDEILQAILFSWSIRPKLSYRYLKPELEPLTPDLTDFTPTQVSIECKPTPAPTECKPTPIPELLTVPIEQCKPTTDPTDDKSTAHWTNLLDSFDSSIITESTASIESLITTERSPSTESVFIENIIVSTVSTIPVTNETSSSIGSKFSRNITMPCNMINCSISGTNETFPCPKIEKVLYNNGTFGVTKPERGKWKISCQSYPNDLECGPFEGILVHEAIWGRFDKTTCGDYPDLYLNCSTSEDTLFRVRERCQFKRHCRIKTELLELTNPCVLYRKYLSVRWSCYKIDPKEITTKFICQDTERKLSCKNGEFVYIYSVFWGRADQEVCGLKNEGDNFFSLHAIDVVSGSCDYRNECVVQANERVLDNPTSKKKYMKLQYRCSSELAQKVCANKDLVIDCKQKKIFIAQANYGRSHPHVCYELGKSAVGQGCASVTRTTSIGEMCNDKSKCTIHVSKDKLGSQCRAFSNYLFVNYFCRDPDDDVPDSSMFGDDIWVSISPGAPIIFNITEYSATFYVERIMKKYFRLYQAQVKVASENTWEEVFIGQKPDFSKKQEVLALKNGTTYEVRIILRNCNICESFCVPFTRFTTLHPCCRIGQG